MKPLIIFDLDGTLLDSTPLHNASFEWAVQQQIPSYIMDEETQKRLEHISTKHKVDFLHKNGYPELDKERVYHDKQVHTSHNMQMLHWPEELPDVIRALEDRYMLAVGSNGRDQFVNSAISCMGLSDVFHLIITSVHVNGKVKPDPYIFNHIMHLMKSGPDNTTIIEDSVIGLAAAKESRAKTIIEVSCGEDTLAYLKTLL